MVIRGPGLVLQTYNRQINVGNHFHDVSDLVSRDYTPSVALRGYLTGHTVFLRLDNGSLM